MAEPTEDEARMALMVLGNALGSEAQHLSVASAIGTIETALDEARKDKERLDWLHTHMCVDGGLPGHYQRWFESPAFDADTFDTNEARDAWTLRAAIDQARGEG